MKIRKIFMPVIILFACFFISGCVNGRIWGDNFLRGWFHGNKIQTSLTDNGTHLTEIQGLTGKDTVSLVFCVSIPLVILLGFSLVSRQKSLRTAVSLLVLLIEHCQSSQEMKRLSELFSHSNNEYRKLINTELKNFKRQLKKE